MKQQLERQYIMMLVPAAAGFATAALLHQNGLLPWRLSLVWARSIFVTAVALAAGLPLWFRALFARQPLRPDICRFHRFQRLLTVITLLPVYLSLVAYAFAVPLFFQAGTLLAALYGAYYFYPSLKRLTLDQRIFRVAPCKGKFL